MTEAWPTAKEKVTLSPPSNTVPSANAGIPKFNNGSSTLSTSESPWEGTLISSVVAVAVALSVAPRCTAGTSATCAITRTAILPSAPALGYWFVTVPKLNVTSVPEAVGALAVPLTSGVSTTSGPCSCPPMDSTIMLRTVSPTGISSTIAASIVSVGSDSSAVNCTSSPTTTLLPVLASSDVSLSSNVSPGEGATSNASDCCCAGVLTRPGLACIVAGYESYCKFEVHTMPSVPSTVLLSTTAVTLSSCEAPGSGSTSNSKSTQLAPDELRSPPLEPVTCSVFGSVALSRTSYASASEAPACARLMEHVTSSPPSNALLGEYSGSLIVSVGS